MKELAPNELLELYRQMALIRRFEEKSAEQQNHGDGPIDQIQYGQARCSDASAQRRG